MGIKIGDVSPLAGMVTGKGAMGKLISQGFGGVIPVAIARDAIKDREQESQEALRAAQAGQVPQSGPGMKKGGKVGSASKRADGIAQRGKTRGKMY